jgi:hypothetical protein
MGLMDEKVVVVTGGGNGIGRAYCQLKESGGISGDMPGKISSTTRGNFTACREAECLLGIDGSLMKILQISYWRARYLAVPFWGTKLEQKHRFKTLPEPSALPLPLSEHVAAGSMAIGATRS